MHFPYRLNSKNVNYFAWASSIVFLTFTTQGCSVLVGNVKPVEEKSERYAIVDLEKSNADWKRLPSQAEKEEGDSAPTDGSYTDVAYQSKKTASIISLNSSCRKSNLRKDLNLQDYSKVLLLGLTEINDYQEKEVQVAGLPAFETTTDGKMPLDQADHLEKVRLKTYVLKKDECLYDLMYIAKPEYFSSQESDFNLFAQSLSIR